MKVLMDSHIVIWAISDDARFSREAREIITDRKNDVYYSAASVWEIAIKHIVHPDKVIVNAERMVEWCEETGFKQLPVVGRHTFLLKTLQRDQNAPPHSDPFDRILLAQAKAENMKFLTHDSLIPYYNEECIISV